VSKILLSVVIPTYNRLDCLPRALFSIVYQQISGVEILIVDDGKESLVEEICLIVSQIVPIVVKVIRNNGEHSASRAGNLGVTQANGEFITFLDDDDFILPGRLESMLSSFNEQQENNVVLISTGRLYEYNNFQKIEVVKKQIFRIL